MLGNYFLSFTLCTIGLQVGQPKEGSGLQLQRMKRARPEATGSQVKEVINTLPPGLSLRRHGRDTGHGGCLGLSVGMETEEEGVCLGSETCDQESDKQRGGF